MRNSLPALTGARFVTAMIVLIFHANAIFVVDAPLLLSLAGPAVSFFFLLSGFVLRYNYTDHLQGDSLRKFYVSRIARIWPLHLFMLLIWLWLITGHGRLTKATITDTPGMLAANALLLQAWVPDLTWNFSFNAVAWSLSAEIFFYLCFPLLTILLQRNPRGLFAGLAAVVISMTWLDAHRDISGTASFLTQFNPCARLFEFALGMATATVVQRQPARSHHYSSGQWTLIELTTTGLLYALLMQLITVIHILGLESAMGHYLGISGLAIALCPVIAILSRSTGIIARILSTPAFIFLGNASFALYLSHLVILHFLYPYKSDLDLLGATGLYAYIAFCILFSGLLYLGIEQPARRLIISLASKADGATGPRSGFSWLATASCAATLLVCTALTTLTPEKISVGLRGIANAQAE